MLRIVRWHPSSLYGASSGADSKWNAPLLEALKRVHNSNKGLIVFIHFECGNVTYYIFKEKQQYKKYSIMVQKYSSKVYLMYQK